MSATSHAAHEPVIAVAHDMAQTLEFESALCIAAAAQSPRRTLAGIVNTNNMELETNRILESIFKIS